MYQSSLCTILFPTLVLSSSSSTGQAFELSQLKS